MRSAGLLFVRRLGARHIVMLLLAAQVAIANADDDDLPRGPAAPKKPVTGAIALPVDDDDMGTTNGAQGKDAQVEQIETHKQEARVKTATGSALPKSLPPKAETQAHLAKATGTNKAKPAPDDDDMGRAWAGHDVSPNPPHEAAAAFTALADGGSNSTIYIVRPGEKGGGNGCLNFKGHAYAATLVRVFGGAYPKFKVPKMLFAFNYDSSYQCPRCVETAQPLSSAHHLNIVDRYGSNPRLGGAHDAPGAAAVAMKSALRGTPERLSASPTSGSLW